MKVMLGQTRPISCGFVENVSQIKDGIVRAAVNDCNLAAFPEASVQGYLTLDQKYQTGYVDANLRAVQDIAEFTRSLTKKPYVVIGYDDHNHTGRGKPFRNMAALIRDGVVVGTYQKQLLPFYDVFLEGRYYEPGTEPFVWSMGGTKWGLLICEDWWNDKGQDDYNYATNPIAQLKAMGIKNFLTINSSPYVYGKNHKRITIAKEVCSHDNVFIFVNQRGGMDELVFDGHSFIIGGTSLQHVVQTLDCPSYDIYEFTNTSKYMTYDPNILFEMYDCTCMAIRDYVRDSGFKEVVVGSSGGIDSAVVIMAACDALGPENVHAVRMRSPGRTDDAADIDAIALHKNLGCHDHCIPIDADAMIARIHQFHPMGKGWNQIADENIQAQLRADVLSYLSNAFGWLILSTSNKTESATGYTTYRGDMSGGYAPLIDILKGEVYQFAATFGKNKIPDNIIAKKPSAQLKLLVDGRVVQFDEDAMLPYPILDAIAESYCCEHISTFSAFVSWAFHRLNGPKEGWQRDKLPKERSLHPMVGKWLKSSPREIYEDIIRRRCDKSEYKRRQGPPGPKLSKIAFGSGRQIPLVKRPF